MNLANRAYQEKRSFIRMRVDTPIEIKVDGRPALSGVCHNLSGGGMLVSISETLPLGTQLEVSVSSNHGHSPVLKALAQVSRVDSQPVEIEPELNLDIKPCHVGLEILSVLEQ